MSLQDYREIEFLKSAAEMSQCPEDTGREVAFAGRSNAGKSSVLNTLTQNKKLARTSKTPGRTQLINYFELDAEHRLVDLPGYGYAKVERTVKDRWQKTLEQYLQFRESLVGLVLIMDCRHPMKELDQVMVNWAIAARLPTRILLNKADKLKRGAQHKVLAQVKHEIKDHDDLIQVQLFSTFTPLGVKELVKCMDAWLFAAQSDTT